MGWDKKASLWLFDHTSGGLFLEPTSDIKVYQNGGWLWLSAHIQPLKELFF